MMSKAWIQFLLVAVPVMSLIGSWLALRVVAERLARRERDAGAGLDEAGYE